jgi:hypothetical protein
MLQWPHLTLARSQHSAANTWTLHTLSIELNQAVLTAADAAPSAATGASFNSGASERTRACFGNVHDADPGSDLLLSKGTGSVAEHRQPETRGRIEGKHVLMGIVNLAGHACM